MAPFSLTQRKHCGQNVTLEELGKTVTGGSVFGYFRMQYFALCISSAGACLRGPLLLLSLRWKLQKMSKLSCQEKHIGGQRSRLMIGQWSCCVISRQMLSVAIAKRERGSALTHNFYLIFGTRSDTMSKVPFFNLLELTRSDRVYIGFNGKRSEPITPERTKERGQTRHRSKMGVHLGTTRFTHLSPQNWTSKWGGVWNMCVSFHCFNDTRIPPNQGSLRVQLVHGCDWNKGGYDNGFPLVFFSCCVVNE